MQETDMDKQVGIGKSALQSVISNLADNSLQHGATKIEIDQHSS